MITKEQAKKELEKWIERKCTNNVPEGFVSPIALPVYDEVVFGEMEGNEIRDYTFRYLMCLAYGFKDERL